MNPVRIAGATIALGKPESWDDDASGRCSTLWVRAEVDRGVPFLRSAWEVPANEIGLMLAGAKLHLGIASTVHPVVNLSIGPTPETFLPPILVEQTAHHGRAAVKASMFFPCGQMVSAEAAVGDGGLGEAVKLAVDEIEKYARERNWL